MHVQKSGLKQQTKPKSKTDLTGKKSHATRSKRVRLRKVKSRELYAGAVYLDCDCYHRNGLQDDCPRLACGVPLCRAKPWPRCDLASHFMDKWAQYSKKLDSLPPTTFCGSKELWNAILREERKKMREARQKLEALKKVDTTSTHKSLKCKDGVIV